MTLCPPSVLITGANRGIGLEFVKQFLKLSNPPKFLFAACRSPDSAKDLQEIAKTSDAVTIIKIDLLDLQTVSDSLGVVQSKLGGSGLSLLINNAGILKSGDIYNVTPEDLNEHYKIHVTGPIFITQKYLPLLKKAADPASGLSINTSCILNITSGLGSIGENTSGRMYAYRAAKAAQNMVTKSLALDLKQDGIFVAGIHPGWVRTELGSQRATLSTEESVLSMFKVMTTFQSENEHGKFYHYGGREMAW